MEFPAFLIFGECVFICSVLVTMLTLRKSYQENLSVVYRNCNIQNLY